MKNSGGIGLSGATFLVFLILKLTGVIAWSWIWVTAPLWIPWALAIIIIGIAFAAMAYGDHQRKKMGENIARRRRDMNLPPMTKDRHYR